MNQSELIAAYEFLSSAHDRVVDIGLLLDARGRKQASNVQAEMMELRRELLPLIGQTVVQDRPDGGSRR